MFPPPVEPAPGAPCRTGGWLRVLLTGLLLIICSPLATALPGDRQQPIRISADSALRDEKQGFTVYTGNVQLKQGSLRIDADRVTIHHQTDAAERIIAEGNPAHLQEQPEPDEGLLHARAMIIEYFNHEERVQLRRDASIEQDGAVVTGDSIDYFIAEQRVRADSDTSGESNRRVEVVIPAGAASRGSESRSTSTRSADDTSVEQEEDKPTDEESFDGATEGK